MTKGGKTTLVGLGALAAAIAIIDVRLLLDDEESNTFSSVIQGQHWLHGLLGYVAVHVARKPSSKALGSSWVLVGSGAVLAAFSSAVFGGGIAGLAIGGGCAWLAWGNSGKT